MILGLAVLIGCQLVGSFLATWLALPLPGPVVGMVLFLVLLMVRRPTEDDGAARAGHRLLGVLPLLFVPAGVGVIDHLGTLGTQTVPFLIGMVGSWLVALTLTALVAVLVARMETGLRSRAASARGRL